ncbi:hypothetical protein AAG906_021740 [Vitis piasezkii]
MVEDIRGVQSFLESSRGLLYILVHRFVSASFGQGTKASEFPKALVKASLSNNNFHSLRVAYYAFSSFRSVTSGIRARLRSGHSKGSMSGSNVEETSEQTRRKENEPTARGRGRKDKSRMEKGLEDLREQIQDLRDGVLGSQVQLVSHDEFMSFQDKVMSMFASVESRAPRMEVPKPHTFSGKRDAKELDNFLWHMELYFEAIALTDEAIKQELRRYGVQDLATAMAIAESLVDYRRGDFSKPKPQSKGNHAKRGGDKGSKGYTPKEGSSKTSSGKDGKGKDK